MSWLQTIGVDAVGSITQYLVQEELQAFMQLNRLCAQLLHQRHQAYYRLPLPSFHRLEFNLNTYRRWLINRQFLVVTSPEQLLSFSRSRIMTHVTDIELRLDEYCMHPTSAPVASASASARASATSSNSPLITLEQSLSQLHAAITLFRHVRSLRLVFRPSSLEHDRAHTHCTCTESITFQNWFMKVAQTCLEVWAPKLVSMEWEIDSHWRCTLPTHLHFPLSHLHRLTALQHFGLFFPPKVDRTGYILPVSLAGFQFPNEEKSVLIFEGIDLHKKDENDRIIPPTRWTNAAHVLWLPAAGAFNTCQYLHETGQLLTNQTTGPYQDNWQSPNVGQPMVSVQRQQLRTFRITPVSWRATMEVDERKAYLKHLFQLMSHNFTGGKTWLESLIIFDDWKPKDCTKHPFTYGPYLQRYRTSLRMLRFTSNIYALKLMSVMNDSGVAPPANITSWRHFPAHCHGCQLNPIPSGQRWKCTVCPYFDYCDACHQSNSSLRAHLNSHLMIQSDEVYSHRFAVPPLPITLIKNGVDSQTVARFHWSRLEQFELRFTKWEMRLHPETRDQLPPMLSETWTALDRTLPKLQSFGVSLGLLPLTVEPLSGILLRINHLTLFDFNIGLVPDTVTLHTYHHYISTSLTTIVTQLRQLESLELQLGYIPSKMGPSDEISFIDCLLPLVLSSNNLRLLTIPAIRINATHCQLTRFESTFQNHLLQFYALWHLLQPSFEPPIDYNSLPTFLYPLLAPIWHSRYDVELIHLQGLNHANHPPPPVPTNVFSRVSGFIQTRVSGFIQTKWSDWRSKWAYGAQFEHEREMQRLEVIQTRSKIFQQIVTRLRTRASQLFQQHPDLTFQPRVFTLRLEPTTLSNPTHWL